MFDLAAPKKPLLSLVDIRPQAVIQKAPVATSSLGGLLSGTGMGSIECGEPVESSISFPNTMRASNAKKRDYKWQGGSEMSSVQLN